MHLGPVLLLTAMAGGCYSDNLLNDSRRGLVEGGEVVCDNPELRESEGPFHYADLGPEWDEQVPAGYEQEVQSGVGGVIADLTGDGSLEIYLPNISPGQLFVRQDDGTYADEASSRLPFADYRLTSSGATAADVDGDGDLDLLVTNLDRPNRLFINDGSGQFHDDTRSRGLLDTEWATMSCAFADLDGDNDLDLFVSNDSTKEGPYLPDPGYPNQLFENVGDGYFTERSELLSASARDGYTFLTGLLDVDLDGDPDMVQVNAHGDGAYFTTLIRNDVQNGTLSFTDIGQQSSLSSVKDGMGLGVGDLNGDTIPDFLISDWGPVWLLESAPDGTWYHTAAARRLVPDVTANQLISWGTELGDLDNDGLLDAVVVFGQSIRRQGTENANKVNEEFQPDAVYMQQPDGTFVDRALDWGMDDLTSGRGLWFLDFNGDGHLDLFRRDGLGKATLALSRCSDNAWLSVQVEGLSPNTRGIGVQVLAETGDRTVSGWITAGGRGLASSGPAMAYLGLGDAEVVDRLVVRWPFGGESVWEDVAVRQQVTVLEGQAGGCAATPRPPSLVWSLALFGLVLRRRSFVVDFDG